MVPVCLDRLCTAPTGSGRQCQQPPVIFLVLSWVCLSFGNAWGQLAGNDAQVVSVKGKVEAGQGNLLQVVDESNAKKLVKLPEMPERILYRAEASLAWLQPGFWVRFATEVNAMGQPTAPLTQMEVFTPIPIRGEIPPDQMARRVPGIYPVAALGNNGVQPFQDGKANKQPIKVLVVGRIAGGQKDRIALQCGEIPIQVRVDEKTKIDVTLHAMNWVLPGDAITVQGLASAKTPDEIYAQTATITAAKKLGDIPKADDLEDEGNGGKGKNKSNRGRTKKERESQEPKGKVDRKKDDKDNQEDGPASGELP